VVDVVVVEVVRGAAGAFGAMLGALFGRALGVMTGALFGRLVGAMLGALFGRDIGADETLLRPLDMPLLCPPPELACPPPPLELPPFASATPDIASAAHNTISLKFMLNPFLNCLRFYYIANTI
jgi:hypothetical protein